MKTALAIIAALALGCDPDQMPVQSTGVAKPVEYAADQRWLIKGGLDWGVVRLHDNEKKVTCWVVRQNEATAVSCLPDTQVAP